MAGDFPHVLVRVRRSASGTLEAEIREAADADAETAATAEGFLAVDVPPAAIVEFPKYLYSADGAARVVASRDEQDKLGGTWSETPPPPPAPAAPPA